MLGIFKKKTELEKLQEQYKKLTEEAFKLSKIDRTKSDQKYAEANHLLEKIDAIVK